MPNHGADVAAPSRDDDEGDGASLVAGGDVVAERDRGADHEHTDTDRERGADRERADCDRGADRDRADGADSADDDDDDAAVPSRRDDGEGGGASLGGDGVAERDRNAGRDRADGGRSPDRNDDRDDRAGHGAPEQAGDDGTSSPDGNGEGPKDERN